MSDDFRSGGGAGLCMRLNVSDVYRDPPCVVKRMSAAPIRSATVPYSAVVRIVDALLRTLRACISWSIGTAAAIAGRTERCYIYLCLASPVFVPLSGQIVHWHPGDVLDLDMASINASPSSIGCEDVDASMQVNGVQTISYGTTGVESSVQPDFAEGDGDGLQSGKPKHNAFLSDLPFPSTMDDRLCQTRRPHSMPRLRHSC